LSLLHAVSVPRGTPKLTTHYHHTMTCRFRVPADKASSSQGPTPVLRPPHRADLPLWLALLLKRQRRASIVAPPWLHPASLQKILDLELKESRTFALTTPLQPPLAGSLGMNDDASYLDVHSLTPPFQPSNTATASPDCLPYHFLELAQTLLAAASDDIPDAESVRRLLRDLREVRMAKVRATVEHLDGGAGVNMTGIGALELGEGREFLGRVVDGLRKIGVSKEREEREAEEERRERGLSNGGRGGGLDDDDEDMQL